MLVDRPVPLPGAVVFVPGAPNPTSGRVILMPAAALRKAPLSVNDALTALVAVGKNESLEAMLKDGP